MLLNRVFLHNNKAVNVVFQRLISAVANEDKPQWCMLSGFSRFVSRKDLVNVLGPVNPIAIEPLLDSNLFPTGQYAMLLPSEASVRTFMKAIGDRYPHRFSIVSCAEDEIKNSTASKHSISNCTGDYC
jgi:hypothetical protein